MKQITVSQLKMLRVAEVEGQVPFELMADGKVIAVVGVQGDAPQPPAVSPPPPRRMTKCPNCKMEYLVTEPDGRPGFFTCKHPKE